MIEDIDVGRKALLDAAKHVRTRQQAYAVVRLATSAQGKEFDAVLSLAIGAFEMRHGKLSDLPRRQRSDSLAEAEALLRKLVGLRRITARVSRLIDFDAADIAEVVISCKDGTIGTWLKMYDGSLRTVDGKPLADSNGLPAGVVVGGDDAD